MTTQLGPPELRVLQDKALWLSAWMIHNANHLRPKTDGMKVGGHQASCASMATLMTPAGGERARAGAGAARACLSGIQSTVRSRICRFQSRRPRS